jgi:protein transport protein SEC39
LPALHHTFSSSLTIETLFRIILTFLPETTPPQTYIAVIQSLSNLHDDSGFSADLESLDISSVQHYSAAAARRRVRSLRLLPLRPPQWEHHADSVGDPWVWFVLHRAYRIDAETGLQTLILDLLRPFYEQSLLLRTWLISRLLPLLRLNYEYYQSSDEAISLELADSMDQSTAINVLLSMTSPHGESTDLARNLKALVAPWMYGSASAKRRRLDSTSNRESPIDGRPETHAKTDASVWQDVNEWLLSRSLIDYDRVVGAFANWNGPDDVDFGGYEVDGTLPYDEGELAHLRQRFGQTGLAVVYANATTDSHVLAGAVKIVSKVASLLQIQLDPNILDPLGTTALPAISIDPQSISATSKASLMQNALLASANPLTLPTSSSIAFLSALLRSLHFLHDFGHHTTARAVATTCLQNTEDVQAVELRAVLDSVVKHVQPGSDWRRTRQQVLWLRDWRDPSHAPEAARKPDYQGVFWRVSSQLTETLLLQALLTVGGMFFVHVMVYFIAGT